MNAGDKEKLYLCNYILVLCHLNKREELKMSRKRIESDVVVIDSGVDCSHPALKDVEVDGVGIIKQEDFQFTEDWKDVFGHGTAVCGIIHRHAPLAKIYVIKIIDFPVQTIEEEHLFAALKYVLKYIRCKVVNMSLGIDMIRDKRRLYELCCKLQERNIKLVAAFGNNGAGSYPAFFDIVLGVTAHHNCNNADEIGYCENRMINLCAYGKAQRILWSDGRYIVSGGNSYACAHVTGIMAKVLGDTPNIDVIAYLREKAKFTLEFPTSEVKKTVPNIKAYKNAAIYPFNKEMHSLLRFEEHLSFSISDVYDTKYSARIHSATNTLLNIRGGNNHVIANVENLRWENIDTLILGHTREMEELLGERIPIAQELVHQALQMGIQVYSLDDYSDIFGKNSLYFSPGLHDVNDFRTLPFGKLYKFSKPVVGVFGTSSKQGKFTLQLYMRYLIQERGYTVAQLGSEPTAYLYGMDACCHFGYAASVDISYALFAAYLNSIMEQLDDLDRDLILAGCQSNTVPYEVGNVNDLTFLQTAFLWGTSPDIVVLCVNPFDEIDYIVQTTRYLESAAECKVVAGVIFPSDMRNPYAGAYGARIVLEAGRFSILKEKFEKAIGIPFYQLGDMEQMNELVDVVLGYLS